MVLSEKVNNAINEHLKISDNYCISIGVISKDKTDYYNITSKGIDKNIYSFDIGSISKLFTAHLVMKCVEEGVICLDDTVDKYIELKPKAYPTIRELLSHCSGFNFLSPLQITIPSYLTRRHCKRNIYEDVTISDVKKILNRKKYKNKKTYSYSDFNYAILGVALSNVLNKTIEELLIDFIKNDLKLQDTNISYNIDKNLCGYIKNRKIKSWEWNKENPYIAAGGITTTVDDMLKFISIQINSNSNYIKNCHIPQDYKSMTNVRPCLGCHTYKKSNQLWHVGGVGTFRSSIIINKTKRVGIIVLGNGRGKNKANVHYICKLIYGEIKRNKIKF